MRSLIKNTAAATAALGLMLGVAGHAADSDAEALYVAYHGAIEAAKLCRGMTFDQAAHDKMAAVINQKVQGQIGGERQKLLVEAKSEMRGIVGSQSCNDSRVQDALALFDSDLAPALQ